LREIDGTILRGHPRGSANNRLGENGQTTRGGWHNEGRDEIANDATCTVWYDDRATAERANALL